MEKTLRKCGSSSGSLFTSNRLDLNAVPFVIPKRFQINDDRLAEQDYHLDIHRFNYNFVVEKAVLETKADREAAEKAAREKAESDILASEQSAEQESPDLSSTDDDCDVIPEPVLHSTNPFLAVTGDVLVPTPSTISVSRPKNSTVDDDIITSFDVQNSNPFDGAELQSLSNFDALKSVLAPEPIHDFSVFENNGNGSQQSRHSPPATQLETEGTIYTSCITEIPNNTPDPVYTTVNKAPAKIKSKKLESKSSIEFRLPSENGLSIHSSYTAIGASDTFTRSISPPQITKPVTPPPDASPPLPQTSFSPFPKIPENVVMRAMQRLNHNEEKCFHFLKDVQELMQSADCSADIAECVSLLDCSDKKKKENVVLVKQFSELGFSVNDIVAGIKQSPRDRDALLDFLTSK